ncbi:MAG: 4a-hydroxytetrahydrobiopterin dehydratase [Thiomicrorhabdus chilensis]|uniref:4a-hydroxytetrahydrobiopterin dehydratase n=1 Tax=Thiomicrorhabdus chilensis TaxID=63656 RepID=UPI00299F0F5D|nr:4a-hydroxytetrahydrobiopterin dehydratase [Thiomicrorhabdus chilensis]MDX1346752.1 4a-hydroxytetrahydrobiopterin dehydratase [Thiomicrorhabdus chilensis]
MTTPNNVIQELVNQHCEEIPKGSKALIIPSIESNLSQLHGWEAPLDYSKISKTYSFKNYHQTIAFVNAVTWIANREDHHPEICFGYNQCTVTLTTHNAKGLTMNDMIMAAKIDALLD